MNNPELERKVRNSFERLRLSILSRGGVIHRLAVEETIKEEEATVLAAVKQCGCGGGGTAPRAGGTVDIAER